MGMRLLLALPLILAACSKAPAAKPRDNRVLQLWALVNPEAKCYPIATPLADSPAPDTAYCAIGTKVMFCEALATKPPTCGQIAERQVEKEEPKVAPPPKLPAAPGGAK